MTTKANIIYVDVDETLVRNYGSKRIPMPLVIEHVRQLHSQGAEMYCWSSGGAAYARDSARELGIEDCFVGYLPKPKVMIDDCKFEEWRQLLQVHPNEVDGTTLESYEEKILASQ